MRPWSRRDLLRWTAAGAAVLVARPTAAAQLPVSSDPFRTLADPKILSEMEMKHVPLIQVPDQVRVGRELELWVRVGRVSHPMEPAHHIEWIEMLIDGRPLARLALSTEGAAAAAGVRLVLTAPAVVEARTRCNLHGYWKASREIPVI